MAKKSRYRYDFSWVDHNNYEVTKYAVATSKKEAVKKFQEQLENAGKEMPVGYTVKSTFLIV